MTSNRPTAKTGGVYGGAAQQFLNTAYEPGDWIAVFLKTYETGEVAQRVLPVREVATERFQRWLRARNAAHWYIYISVNAIARGRRSRTRDAIAAIRHVFLEIDCDAKIVLRKLTDRADLPAPSYVLRSSRDRAHVFWRVHGFTHDHVEVLQRQLALELGADPAATPCTQTTRLPGFRNHKYPAAPLVTIEYRDTATIREPADFPQPELRQNLVKAAPAFPAPNRSADVRERVKQYLAAIPPAIAGQHGDLHTFRVCCRLARGFALEDDDALMTLADWNNRCEPPWTERELLDKLRCARRYGREPIGGLLPPSRPKLPTRTEMSSPRMRLQGRASRPRLPTSSRTRRTSPLPSTSGPGQ